MVGLLVALAVPAPALAVNQTVTASGSNTFTPKNVTDGVASTADNTLFADQAVFVP